MNKKLLKVFASLSLLTLVVNGCGQQNNSDQPSTPSNSVESESNSTSPVESSTNNDSVIDSSSESVSNNDSTSSSETPSPEEYAILLLSHGNANVELSHDKACAGETITLTITLEEGYALDRIEVNNKVISGTSFEMPNTSAVINVYTTLVNKDGLIIDGDISAKLVEENGIFVARNVPVETNSYVTYRINGEALSVVKINNSKSFANIDIRTSSNTKGGFTLGGNAVYDFYYDPSDSETPCYIQRVGILNLPTTEQMIEDLFAGSVKSESTLFPQNVNKVEYYSSTKNEKYEWNLYSDNSSYATVVNPITNKEKAIVYKAQIGNVYKVVDNYLEGTVDPTYVTRGDTTAYSAQYDIVSAVSKAKYQKLQSEVTADAALYSHTMEALDAEFYQAYRNGYVGNIYNDVTVDHGYTVNSYRVDNDDFKVELDSWVRWSESSIYQSSTGYRSAYVTYDVDFEFTASGALKSCSYTETFYGTDYYDFKANTLKAGYEIVDPKKEVIVTYSYGDALAGQPNVDVSKYFTQSISDITVKSKNSVDDEPVLSISTDIRESALSLADNSHNVTFVCNPVTALDMWQYGIVSSSDLTVVGHPSTSSGQYRALTEGEATITIGNHTANANDVVGVKTIKVANVAYIKGIFMYTVYPYPNYDETFNAGTGIVVSGNVYEIQLAGATTSGNYAMNNLGLIINEKTNAGLVEFKYNEDTGVLTIDASKTNVAEQTTVNVEVYSSYKVADWPTSSLTFYVLPRQEFETSLVGKWTSESTSSYVEITSDTTGVIHYVSGSKETKYDFSYTYDNKLGKVEITKKPEIDGSYVYLYMYVDPTDGALCVCFASEKNWSDEIVDYIGSYYYDEDEYEYYVYYEPFFKN